MSHLYDRDKFLNMLKEQNFEFDLHEHDEVIVLSLTKQTSCEHVTPNI